MIHGFLFISVVTSMILPTVVLGKVTTARSLPNWYPFEWEGKLGLCLLLLLFEYSAAFTFITLDIVGDIFLASVLLIIGGQLESLGYRLKNLPSKDTKMWQIKFKECVQDYNCIFKINTEFQRIFSGIIFIQALLSCLLICLSAFALGLANDIGTFILFFSFIFGMLYEVFLMCYAGDYLTEKSEELLFNLYSSSWPDIPRDCRKMMLIFCVKLNNPIIVKFGIIQDLHLRTFTKIIDAAYKLYALLQQVPE
ncbi:odorant receptor 94a-like [Hermetia illucens]|nr:odorant receptor 94a-like [Hermetia illucens]